MRFVSRGIAASTLGLMLLAADAMAAGSAPLEPASPLDRLVGRWVGEGRLGVKDGQSENVKCRVTYIPAGAVDQLKQTVRCASAGGSIEVQSTITHAAGDISGTWSELTRNMQGDLTGQVTPRGFHVTVKGADLTANMNVVINGEKQIIEIQFHNSSLIGLTLVLAKG
jgi:hypothetical protein